MKTIPRLHTLVNTGPYLKRGIVRNCFFLFLLFSITAAHAQKRLEILHAGSLVFDESLGNGAKRLIGDVQFKHMDALMYCDSAYFYNDNSLEAFGNVHINQHDSVHLYGDHLRYTGNDRKAVITGNVIVHKGDMKLYTNEINYDMGSSVGYYLVSGRIVNKDNELISRQGHYYAKTNDVYFKNNVVLTHRPAGEKQPDFVINSDTMRYNSLSKITYFYGPTTIKNEENLIYCEDGWYHTEKELARFSKNSYILTTEQKMLGDSVFYDGKQSIGRALGNIQIIDTTQNTIIKGDYAIHYELTDLSIVTGNALFIKPFTDDTLFLHADTLKARGVKKKEKLEVKPKVENSKSTEGKGTKNKKHERTEKGKKKKLKETEVRSEKIEDEKQKTGNSGQEIVNSKQEIVNREQKTGDKKHKEESNHLLFAYHKVKFFKKDFQGKCDSLYYSTNDSVMKMYGAPIFWSDENQLTADSAKMYTGKKSLKSIELEGNGFVVSEKDSVHYNQIRGKKMKGFFNDSTLYLIKLLGNGQTIYYDFRGKLGRMFLSSRTSGTGRKPLF